MTAQQTKRSRKKLIEVSIPLEAINRESAREKSIRHGHPSTLHLWWARRPLAACRGVLFAQLVDDPSACPEEFPTKQAQDAERDRLHKLIAAMVPWEASNNETILNEARYEIARSVARDLGDKLPPISQMKPQQIIDYLQKNAAPVYDPFSGGGSIPLEAQRLGLKVIASDLNPVAVLICKALIEFPAKFAGRKPVNPEVNELHQWTGSEGLANDVRYYGHWMREQAEKKIGHLYPKVKLKDGKEATVVAWLWARTVPSPDPRAKGAHVPLASSFVLSAKAGKEVIVKPVVNRANNTWAFKIDEKPSKADIETAKKGTVDRQGGVCLLTGTPMPFTHIRAEGKAGRMGVRLMAIVAEGQKGRFYVEADDKHVKAAQVPPIDAPELEQELPNNPRDFKTSNYGMSKWRDLFTARQLVALSTFSDLAIAARAKVLADAKKHWSGLHADDTRRLAENGLGPDAFADAVATYLGFAVAKATTRSCSLALWEPGMGRLAGALGRQALPMQWAFAETNPIAGAGGDIEGTAVSVAENLDRLGFGVAGTVRQVTAQENHLPEHLAIATDPPYYDNINYADLSDFFYVWHRKTLHSVHPELFRRIVTPKTEELIAAPYRDRRVPAIKETDWKKMSPADRAEAFFMFEMRKALSAIAMSTGLIPTTIYYAFKQSEIAADGVTSAGWASFLQAIVESGLAVDATWPVRTEATNALKKDMNALASSIVLVCRRRDTRASGITRADFLRALRREMPAALAEIRRAGVGPTDIQQAAIGPGIGIFSRHAEVLNTDGTPMLVKDALKLINQVREEITSSGDADYDSETRFALDWFAAKGFENGRSGDAIIMTNAVDLSVDGVNATGFFLADGGAARLLRREELEDHWDPAEAGHVTVWEACQHLIKRLRAEDGGVDAAAELYNLLGSIAEPAHALARRLYDICEQNQWAAEGYVYNQLHQEWGTIEKRAAALAESGQARDLFSQ